MVLSSSEGTGREADTSSLSSMLAPSRLDERSAKLPATPPRARLSLNRSGGEEEGRLGFLVGRAPEGLGVVLEPTGDAITEVALHLLVSELEGSQIRPLLEVVAHGLGGARLQGGHERRPG